MIFQPGDVVKLTSEALANKKFTPTQLVDFGFPNRFTVTKVFEVEIEDTLEKIHALSLLECCGQIKDASTGESLCDSHPSSFFMLEDRGPSAVGLSPVKEMSIETPLGRLLSMGMYKKPGGEDQFIVNLPFGLEPFSVSGPWANLLHSKMKDLGIL